MIVLTLTPKSSIDTGFCNVSPDPEHMVTYDHDFNINFGLMPPNKCIVVTIQ